MPKWLLWLGSAFLGVLVLAGCAGKPPAARPDPALQALTAAGQVAGLGQPTVRTYNPRTMYEAIDGEADLFKSYNVRRLTSARFQQGKEVVEVEVFDQGSPLDAYGVFSSLAGEGTPARVGAAGVTEADETVRFWQDRYFVRVSTVGEQRVPLNRLVQVARDTGFRLPNESNLPTWTKAKLPPGKSRYVARNVLGYGFLSQALVVESTRDGQTLTFALMRADNEAGAQEALGKLRDLSQGRRARQDLVETTGADEAFTGTDPGLQPLLAARQGNYLAIADGPWGSQQAAAAVREAFADLPAD